MKWVHTLNLDKEKRVEHLQGVAARRITQAALSRGWSTWIDQYFEVKRERQLLRAAGARLTRPALSACLSMWQREWEAAERGAALKAERRRLVAHQLEVQAELVRVQKLVREANDAAGVSRVARTAVGRHKWSRSRALAGWLGG